MAYRNPLNPPRLQRQASRICVMMPDARTWHATCPVCGHDCLVRYVEGGWVVIDGCKHQCGVYSAGGVEMAIHFYFYSDEIQEG